MHFRESCRRNERPRPAPRARDKVSDTRYPLDFIRALYYSKAVRGFMAVWLWLYPGGGGAVWIDHLTI